MEKALYKCTTLLYFICEHAMNVELLHSRNWFQLETLVADYIVVAPPPPPPHTHTHVHTHIHTKEQNHLIGWVKNPNNSLFKKVKHNLVTFSHLTLVPLNSPLPLPAIKTDNTTPFALGLSRSVTNWLTPLVCAFHVVRLAQKCQGK